MKLSALLPEVEAVGGFEADVEITSVTDDTCRVTPGCAFVCIKGRSSDWRGNARRAVSGGASVLIAEEDCGLAKTIVVRDARRAYALMCAALCGNCHRGLRMIGITGTNGKTTTACLLRAALEASGVPTGLIGTVGVDAGGRFYPAELTTPDPSDLHRYLRSMADSGCEACVMEVSSQALDGKRVCGIDFECGIFTNISPEHLDYHGTMENYALAKSALMRSSAAAVINADDEYAELMRSAAKNRSYFYSVGGESYYKAMNVKLGENGAEFDFCAGDEVYRAGCMTPGMFSVRNALAALSAAHTLGADMPKAVCAVAAFSGIPGRMERVRNDFGLNIIIDFAHTPASLENALMTLRQTCRGRLITVFGCGGDRDRKKRPLMCEAALRYSDKVFVTSDNPRTEDPEAIIADITRGVSDDRVFRITDRTAAIRSALYSARQGDTVLIAGKGHEKYQIIGVQKIHYDEREIIRKLLEDKARF
ncbi:MAG: UDP-N-acetylmuramoyl-L-alanyl-D-glutamate--2,6-diaminopimelate ligase [Clostridia bacterium]|nr:UDP-N-acetylmuramoyl-L-alanyl-D-glutamate--2,6-diaminopimelate ligase [Clostridia bacterium]